MSYHDITLTVNGERHQLQVKSNELLLNVLRDRLLLTGPKYGCGIAECGACTILKDDDSIFSCLVPAVVADGWAITTIEGMSKKDGTLSHLQQAFVDNAAIQCGYCTPGMITVSEALLRENPDPTEDEIRDYLRGNYCRCTGYTQIVQAVLEAAQRMKEDQQ